MVAAAAVTTRALDANRRLAAADQSAAADLANRLPRLIAKAREIAASVVHGVHGRRRAGLGETFWQFRPFTANEPAQRIDWRRSARGDHLYVRELEWEAAHSYFLWLDCSPSMAFLSSLATDSKIDRAVVLGLALSDVLVRGGERVALLGLTRTISSREVIQRLGMALGDNAESVLRQETPPYAPLPARSKMVLISDFLCDPKEFAARLREYANRGATGALLMVADPAEETFPFEGETLFLDTDSSAFLHAGRAEAFRDSYESRLASHREAIRVAAKSAGFSFQLHRTDRSAAEALLALTMGLYAKAETS